jgi:hypothetical protein
VADDNPAHRGGAERTDRRQGVDAGVEGSTHGSPTDPAGMAGDEPAHRGGGERADERRGGDVDVEVDVGQLVSGRAALLGLGRRGQVSANGSCRLLPTADGWVAVNLARPSDVEAVGALVERVVDDDPWAVLAGSAERMPGAELVERAILLGVPAALVPPARPAARGPQVHTEARGTTSSAAPTGGGDAGWPAAGGMPRPNRLRHGLRTPDAGEQRGRERLRATANGATSTRTLVLPRPAAGGDAPSGTAVPFTLQRLGAARADDRWPARLVVVDLSAMWAGPLCARLLGLAGMRVIKVESVRRPDGARAGDPRFFDWLHGGHASVGLDLATSGGRAALAQLVAAADVVIESSRPRALAQLGIDVEAAVGARPGITWVSITGHGREGAAGRRVAFGDDAAVAAGLVAHDDQDRPVFCGDAIADPITGLSAAVGALSSVAAGGGHLVDVPMVGAVAAAMAVPVAPLAAHRAADGTWQVATATGVHLVASPRVLPPATAPADALGTATRAVLRALGIAPC